VLFALREKLFRRAQLDRLPRSVEYTKR
jgi:hypothetical protein